MIEDLKGLPKEHYLRNTPLIEIGAQYLQRGSKVWADVTPAFGIANKTYNDLGDSWTHWDEWRATIDPYFDEDRADHIGQNGNVGYE